MNDGLKMRASVRMTRYLESWGAARPFAHLSHRESVSSDSSSYQGRRRKVSSHLGIGSLQLQTAPAGVTSVAECLLLPLVLSVHTELRGVCAAALSVRT